MSRKLLANRRFWPLFWTQFLGALNDNFFKNALVILLTYRNVVIGEISGAPLVALAGGVFIFPFFLFSATAGQMADHFEKSDMVRVTKWTELLFMILACLGFIFNSHVFLLLVLFLMGAQSAFFGPLKYGIIPHLVKETELTSATGLVTTGTFLSILIGTLLGSNVVSFDNFLIPLCLGLIGFAFIGIFSSRFLVPAENANPKVKIDYTFFRPTWDILKMTTKRKEIFRTVLGISWFWFMGAAILSVLPNYCKDIFSGSEQVSSLFLAIFTIGMGVGSFIVDRISRGKVERGVIPLAALGMSLFLVDFFYVGVTWDIVPVTPLSLLEFLKLPMGVRAIFDILMVTIFGGLYIVPKMTVIQEITKRGEISRTIAGNNIWNALFMVLASVFVMFFSSYGLPQTVLALAVLNMIASFFLYAHYSEFTLRFLQQILIKTFYKVEIRGAHKIPETGGVIFVSNHVSFIDWFFISAVSPRPVRYVIDHNYYNMPMGPLMFSQAKLIPISTRKENSELLEVAFDKISKNLNSGAALGLFPEGFITRDGKMRPFQPGISRIIKKNPSPVVPISLDGLWGSVFSYDRGKVLWKFPRKLRRIVTVTVHEPIGPEDFDIKKLKEIIASSIKGDHHE